MQMEQPTVFPADRDLSFLVFKHGRGIGGSEGMLDLERACKELAGVPVLGAPEGVRGRGELRRPKEETAWVVGGGAIKNVILV